MRFGRFCVVGAVAAAAVVGVGAETTATAQGPAPTFPFEAELAKPLGFRTKPGLDAPHVLPHPNNYLQPPTRLKVLSATGTLFAANTFCNVEYQGKQGFIRCDDAAALKIQAPAPSPAASTPPPQTGPVGAVETRTFTDGKSRSGVHHVFGYAGDDRIFFRGMLQVDADGSPHTYHVGMTCTDGENDWDHDVVSCGKICEGAKCKKQEAAKCAASRGFKSAPRWGQAGTVVQCKMDGDRCVDGDTKQVTCSMTPHANDGLDNLANGGRPGDLYGMAKRHDGKLCILNDDANGGHYISPTAWNRNRAGAMPQGVAWNPCEPSNYVNSETINYVALPGGTGQLGVHQGDIVAVANWDTNQLGYAIFADVGGKAGPLGEGSIALATALSLEANPKGGGKPGTHSSAKDRITYLVFPKTHQLVTWPLQQSQIDAEGTKLMTAWGGVAKFRTAASSLPMPQD